MSEKIRIQKVISQAGICSRRKAEEYIKEGRVKVDGRPAKLGMKIDKRKQIISIDDKRINISETKKLYYLALHKPRGYITTMKDQFGRKDITELTKGIDERLFPVGRLDMNSEGLILLTNDGEFANKLAHPKYEMEKTYRVTTSANVPHEALVKLAEGVLVDGEMTLPAYVEINIEDKTRTVLLITIREGKNRQIRKMMEEVGLPVNRLKRTEIGIIKLGMLQTGHYRDLTKKEIKILLDTAKNNLEKQKN